MSVGLGELVAHLDEYLEIGAVEDYGPNGLQVEGREEVRRIVTGVSACQELFRAAAERGADAVMVHHGIFWQGMPYSLTGLQYHRVAELVRSGIGLVAYHLPLDRHAEVGNNAVAARRLGLRDLAPFGRHGGVEIGFRGAFPEPLPREAFLARLADLYGQAPLAFGREGGEVSTVGIISGGAQKALWEAVGAGLDAFVTGEASEWVMNVARESDTCFVSAGHYATERLGIQELGRYVANRFGVEVEFVDVPNPV